MNPILSKPDWLKKKISVGELANVNRIMKRNRLNTICEEARCPNISECYSRREATFLIMGNACTRQCSFCNVMKMKPSPLDPGEPSRVAKAVVEMELRHAVITSPTRDDLSDGGASHFFSVVGSVKKTSPGTTVELLIPDFLGREADIKTAADSGAEIIGHNMETVKRLYSVRKGAEYKRSLHVLQRIKEISPLKLSKSGIMLGLGETRGEVLDLFKDLHSVKCDILTIGQYLSPGREHHPVAEFIHPDIFDELKNTALDFGFTHVESGPYVRSSYHASDALRTFSIEKQPSL